MLVGKWDEAMYYVLGDPTAKPKGYDPMMEAVLLWQRDQSVTNIRFQCKIVLCLIAFSRKNSVL
jgi:hypothetical protein